MKEFAPILAACLLCACMFSPATAGQDAEDKTPELADEVIDPYVQPKQRTRFLKAAGKDNELDAEEFAATQGKDGAFARPFDNWDVLKRYDRDGNGKIDWFEADAYRQAIRVKVLAAMDANKDGRLTGDERQALNKSLAAGKLPVTLQDNARKAARGALRDLGLDEETRKKYDADGDGKLSREEMRKLAQDKKQEVIDKFDTDGDGKLNAEEKKAAIEAARAKWKARAEAWMRKRYDKDGDGQLSEEETAAMEEAKKRIRERMAAARKRKAELVEKYDTDGDGKLTGDERKAAREEMRKQWILRRYDKDGDGELNAEEQAAYDEARKKWQERVKRWRERHNRKKGGSTESSRREEGDSRVEVIESGDGSATVILGR
ncbi:MAG: EF-hand domain-containing protein [Phycisphaerae bacterium]